MPTSFGGFLFWVASIIAALIVVWVLWNFLWDWQGGAPIIRLPLLLIAGVIWLVGWVAARSLEVKIASTNDKDDRLSGVRLPLIDPTANGESLRRKI